MVPNSNISGLPEVTVSDFKNNDPSRLNRIIRLLATQLQGVQVQVPTTAGITGSAGTPSTPTATITGGGGSGGGSSAASVVTIQGTHLQRLSTFLAPAQPAGCLYYETDRTVTYLNFLTPSTAQAWQYLTGTMNGAFALRPSDLGTYDAGFMFYASDLDLTYQWSGTSWTEVSNIEPVLQDTHANRLTGYPSTIYAPNTLFFETDRKLFYIIQNATGTVNTAGTAVTWVSGNHFINTGTGFNAVQWPAGTTITIAGTAYSMAAVASGIALTLTGSAGVQAGVPYTVTSGRWVYASGQMVAAWASLPTDLGENDSPLTFFDNTNSLHIWQWTGSAYTWGPGDRHSGEFGMFDANPGTGWHLSDGATNQTKYAADGTRVTNFTVPDQREFYLKASNTYTGAGVAAVAPTITNAGSTGSQVTGISVSGYGGSTSGVDSGSGTTILYTAGLASATVADHTHTHNVAGGGGAVTDPGHAHSIAATTAAANGTPPTFAILPYYRL